VKGNEIIKKAILEKQPYSFGKIGGIESSHILNYIRTKIPSLVRGNTLSVNAGICTPSINDLKIWLDSSLKSIEDLDYILEWCPEQGDKEIIDNVWKGKQKFNFFPDLEPFLHGEEGWQYSLHNKKVLVVSPFHDTIISQSKRLDKIWNGVIPKEVKVVKSPYPSELLGSNSKTPFWIHLDSMKRQIDMFDDFDVAIVGCGGYSLLLLEYIKSLGIPCIHLGGGTQLIFGILGKRWDNNPSFVNSSWYGTKEWVRPFQHEVPVLSSLVENGCYW